jgi:hypothetical protein
MTRENTPKAKKRALCCCVCGGDAGKWQQHFNRDTGYGVCFKCVAWLRKRGESETEITSNYGQEGVNWGAAEGYVAVEAAMELAIRKHEPEKSQS